MDENRELIEIRSQIRGSNIDFVDGGFKISGHEVVLLGAGFSHAVSEAFPLNDDLGRQAAERARLAETVLPPGGFHDGNFETWLSQLAEAPPYCLEDEVFARRAILVRTTRALALELRDREYVAFSTDAPSWLYDLVGLMHHRRMVVITFNYDTAVETAVRSHSLWHRNGIARQVVPDDVLANMPPLYAGGVPVVGVGPPSAAEAPAQTFQLLKLHGSLDWFWSSGDRTGATLRRVTTLGEFGAPALDDPERRDREVPGLVPFIVPPTATKSVYFQNPLTRYLWRTAFEALRHAERVALVGYSLPGADLLTLAMLSDALRDRKVTVEVVNPEPAGLLERLRGLGIDSPAVTSGSNCVGTFVSATRDRIASLAADQVRALPTEANDALVVVHWAVAGLRSKRASDAYVQSVERSDGELRLVHMVGATDTHRAIRVSELRSQLGQGTRISLSTSSGELLPVIGLKLSLGPSPTQIGFLELQTCGRVTA